MHTFMIVAESNSPTTTMPPGPLQEAGIIFDESMFEPKALSGRDLCAGLPLYW